MVSYIIPVFIAIILGYGLYKKVDIFEEFIVGAKDGMKTTVKILPTLICLMTCVGMLKASGALEQIVGVLQPFLNKIGISPDIVPLALMRPISGSGALCIYNDILKTNGPDSNTSRMASVLFGSTETTFYAIAVYFGAVNIKKTRYTLPCALSADLISFLMSSLTIYILFR